jgi:hypothetical protein
VTDRLRTLAAHRPGSTLGDLQRRFTYDRLLARVFTAEPDHWVLKGAGAILARLPTAARHSKDIDLYRTDGDLTQAHRALAAAAAVDLGDHFRFTLGPAQPLTQGASALRVPITAYLGPTEFASFHADLVTNLTMTATPDDVPALVEIDLGLLQPRYRAYPVVDHIADKVCAMLKTHLRAGGDPIASTRYRDLVDLATFARTSEIDGAALSKALRSEPSGETSPSLTIFPTRPDPTGGRDTHAPSKTRRTCQTAISTPRFKQSARCSTPCSPPSGPSAGTRQPSPGADDRTRAEPGSPRSHRSRDRTGPDASAAADDGRRQQAAGMPTSLAFACDVCGGVDARVSLARRRASRGLTAPERAQYLHQ